MRKRHGAVLTVLSPDGVHDRNARSRFSVPLKRSCTAVVDHSLNRLPMASTAAGSMASIPLQSRNQGEAALAMANCRSSTDARAKMRGLIQIGSCSNREGMVRAMALFGLMPSKSGIENQAGADRPERSAYSIAIASKRVCCPVAR